MILGISFIVLKRCNTESHSSIENITYEIFQKQIFDYSLDVTKFIECSVTFSRSQNNSVLLNFLALKLQTFQL